MRNLINKFIAKKIRKKIETNFDGNLIVKLPDNKSFLIGIAQAIAIIPGISRSGMTITSALLLGLNSNNAAKFSFLLAIPAITGAGIITMIDVGNQILISNS